MCCDRGEMGRERRKEERAEANTRDGDAVVCCHKVQNLDGMEITVRRRGVTLAVWLLRGSAWVVDCLPRYLGGTTVVGWVGWVGGPDLPRCVCLALPGWVVQGPTFFFVTTCGVTLFLSVSSWLGQNNEWITSGKKNAPILCVPLNLKRAFTSLLTTTTDEAVTTGTYIV